MDHANFKAEVACYTAADPMPTIRKLSECTGVPEDKLIRYVLVKYAVSASDALLTMQPIVFQQMRDIVDKAEEVGSDDARLKAYSGLKQIVEWLGTLTNPESPHHEPAQSPHE